MPNSASIREIAIHGNPGLLPVQFSIGGFDPLLVHHLP